MPIVDIAELIIGAAVKAYMISAFADAAVLEAPNKW